MESVEETGLRQRKVLKPIQIRKLEKEEDEAEEEEEPLSPGSLMFHQPDFNIHVMAKMGCNSRINPDVIKAKFPDTILKHPRFSSLQVVDEKRGGQMKWVPTMVNLDHHIIVPDIDHQNMDSPDKFVEDYVTNLSKSSLDKSKPMWDLHLLNIKTSDAESVGIFRIHHSLGDGTSLMSLLLAATRQVENPHALPTIPGKRKQAATKGGPRGFWKCIVACWSVLRMLWYTVVDVFMFIATTLFLKDTETPLKGPPGVEFTPRRFVHRTVSLDDMKLIKNAMNATINDVALGVTQAGLSRYLNRKYGQGKSDEAATEKNNNIPKKIRLRSLLLINLRPAGIQALADMMEKDTETKWGNMIGYVLLPFTIDMRDNPLDYVREAKATIDRKKSSLEAICTFSMADIFLKIFGVRIASRLSQKVSSRTTMCFSNLVGPQEEIGFYGHPMAYLAPGSYGQPHGLMINYQSYVNKMTIVLSVDESTVPDPHQLCDDIEESLKLIKDAVIARESHT